jgi:hypothetical protein
MTEAVEMDAERGLAFSGVPSLRVNTHHQPLLFELWTTSAANNPDLAHRGRINTEYERLA